MTKQRRGVAAVTGGLDHRCHMRSPPFRKPRRSCGVAVPPSPKPMSVTLR